jgi:monofunctional glycosyltransferase
MVKFLVSIGVATLSLVGLAATGVGLFLATTPKPNDLKSCLTTKMYSVRLCATDADYAKIRAISPHLKNAILVSEDASFYDHKGIDWYEMQESFIKNWQTKQYARGGSTITQQLAKNVYLTSEKTLLRKAREILIAFQIEESYSKDEIFERYLNVVEFGENLFGVTKASRYYFKKSPSEITPSEAAFLAFLLPSPKKYSASFHKKQLTPFARSQMQEIVRRLLRFKRISQEEHDQALAEITHFFGSPPQADPLPESEAEEDA